MLLGLLIEYEDWLTKHGFNPCVAVRELRSRQRVTWTRWLIGIGAVAAGVGPVPLLMSATVDLVAGRPVPQSEFAFYTFASGATSLLTLLLVIPAAVGIVSEHEKRTLEPLRATPLTAGEVVGGKIIANVDAGLLLLCILVPLHLWACLLGVADLITFPGMTVLYIGLVVWASCLGTLISAVSLSTVSAVIRTFVVLGLLRVVPFLGTVFSTWRPGQEDALGVGGVVFMASAVTVLALPVAYRALARIQRYAAHPGGRFAAALTYSCLLAAVVIGTAVTISAEAPAAVIHLLYPPSGALLENRHGLMGPVADGEESSPLLWLVALELSLLGSACFQSLAAMGYEAQARSRVWRILMFGTDTQ